MAGIRLAPEESLDPTQQQHPLPQQQLQTGREVASDDERSVAADSWSIKSDYGSTLDDEQRHADAAEALSSAVNFRAASDYRFSFYLIFIPFILPFFRLNVWEGLYFLKQIRK